MPHETPYPFEIRNGKVFENGEETGSLEGEIFKSLSSDSGVEYAFNLQFIRGTSPAENTLRTYYGVRNGLGVLVIEGALRK